MINGLIALIDNEIIDVYRFEEATTKNGGSRLAPVLKKSKLRVSIQTSNSAGQELINNVTGKKDKVAYTIYSPRYKMQLKDLVLREDGFVYEIQHIDKNGKGTILQHDKYYIVKYSNQKVLKNE